MAYDPASGRLYASCGIGYVYVFEERTPDQYDLVGQVQTAVMAKTGCSFPN